MTHATVPQNPPARRAGPMPAMLALIGLLVLLGVAALAVVAASLRLGADRSLETLSHTQAAEGAERAEVRVQFGAGNLSLAALDATDSAVARMDFEGPSSLRPTASYQVRGGVGELGYVSRDADQVWQNLPFIGRARDHADLRVRLAPNLPLALDVEAGAADTMLDLTRLRVSRLDLRTGAADTRVRLPEAAGFTTLAVKAGVAQLSVDVPRGVAADIAITSGLGEHRIDQTRFPSAGNGRYRSPDYASAANRIEMHLELGIGELTVR